MKTIKLEELVKALEVAIKNSEGAAKGGLIEFKEAISDFPPNSDIELGSAFTILAADVVAWSKALK